MRLFPVINLFLNETQTSGNYGFKETDLDSLHKHLQHTGALVWVEGVHLRVPVADAVARRASITVDLLCFSAHSYFSAIRWISIDHRIKSMFVLIL